MCDIHIDIIFTYSNIPALFNFLEKHLDDLDLYPSVIKTETEDAICKQKFLKTQNFGKFIPRLIVC